MTEKQNDESTTWDEILDGLVGFREDAGIKFLFGTKELDRVIEQREQELEGLE